MRSQHPREILWVWESVGCVGKSILGRYIRSKRDGFLVTNGKHSDITYAFQCEKYIIFDFARARQEMVPYALMENFKDLAIFSTKYESVWKEAEECKMVVFANFPPEEKIMSKDRWNIVHLNLDPFAAFG